MAQLYALCRQQGNEVVKHVQLTAALQNAIEPYFLAQEAQFLDGVQHELDFTGDWKPDDDELLVVRQFADAQILLQAAAQNAVALPPLDPGNFQNEGIKALFTAVGVGAQLRVLVQNFGAQQILTTKLALLFDGNVFRRVTEPSFALANAIVGIITAAGDLKFKSYSNVRRVFEITGIFRAATDVEINNFCAHPSLAIADANAFLAAADEGIRKFIHAIQKLDVLNQNPVAHISGQAAAIGFPLQVQGNRIEVPLDRGRAKAVLSFLLDKVYRGSLDQRLFITNSHRPL
jgi:hypothetical protein